MVKDEKKIKESIETAKMLEDVELEKSIVGYMMSMPFAQIQEVRAMIDSASYFYHTAPRHIYQLICWFNDKGDNVTPMLIMPEVMRRGKIKVEDFTDILSYQNSFVSYIDLLDHIAVLVDYAKRREVFIVSEYLKKEGTTVGAEIETAIEETKRKLDDILYQSKSTSHVSMQSLLSDIQNIVDKNAVGEIKNLCIPTGFSFIDKQDGLSKGDLDIIAAESSIGKTSMAISMMINVMKQGHNVAFYSTEMKPEQITARILSFYTNLYSSTILKKPMCEEQMEKFNQGMTDVYEAASHLYFHEKNTSNIAEIMRSIRKLHSEHNIQGVVVDFIQRLSGRDHGENDDSFYSRVSQQLKDLALELDIWIVLLSQLNRSIDSGKDSRDNTKYIPTMSRLRGSGQIAEAADNIWLIYRPDFLNKEYGKSIIYPEPFSMVNTEGTAMIIVAKGRNVGTGSFICGFNADTTHFYDLEQLPYRGIVQDNATEATPQTKEQKEIQTILPF